MRWRTPVEGDMREVRRFAWLPVELDSGKTVWLERYLSREWLRSVRSGVSDEWVLRWTTLERLPLVDGGCEANDRCNPRVEVRVEPEKLNGAHNDNREAE